MQILSLFTQPINLSFSDVKSTFVSSAISKQSAALDGAQTFVKSAANSVSQSTVDYSLKLSDFLKQVSPDFQFPENLSFLKDQTITTLNVIIQLISDLYKVSKDNLADISSAIVHVLNFYMGTRNSTSWADISVGFASLCLSLFKLDSVKNSAKYIQQIVGIFINNLKSYFVKAESAERSVKSFWKDLSTSNPRTLFGIVHSCSGILTSVICIKNFVNKSHTDGNIVMLITEIANGILRVGSDLRQHAVNVTLLLARIYDWIYINAEALMTFKFNNLIWELPKDQSFESKYVDMTNVMRSFLEDPLYLETHNLKLETIRDRLNKLRSQGEDEINKEPTPSGKGAFVRYLAQLDTYVRTVEAKLNPDNTKVQPLSVTLRGQAGCGKTCASSKIGLMMQVIAGRAPDENLINNRGGDPKFEERITGSTDVVVFDDFANDQSRKMSTKDVLDIVNTSKEVIPKARADEKGEHQYNNIGTIFTTNDENLGMSCFRTVSVDSLLRRMGIVVELGIKEEYCLSGTDRLDMHHPDVSDETFNTDVYTVSLRSPRGVMDTPSGPKVVYVEIEYERHEGNNEWRDAVLKLQDLLITQWDTNSARHRKSQDTSNNCPGCALPVDMCMCSKLKAEALECSRAKFSSLFYDQPKASIQQCFWAMDNFTVDFSSQAATQVSLMIFSKNLAAYAFERSQMYYNYKFTLLVLFILLSFIPLGLPLFFLFIYAFEHRYYLQERRAHMERSIEAGTYIRDAFKARCTFYGVLFCTGAMTLSLLFKSLSTISEVLYKAEDSHIPTMSPSPVVTPVAVSSDEKQDDEEYALCKDITFTSPPQQTNSDDLGYFIQKPRPAQTARCMSHAQALAAIGKGIAEAHITAPGSPDTYIKCLPFGSERLIPLHGLHPTSNQDVIVTHSINETPFVNRDIPQTHIQPLYKKGRFFKSKKLDAALVHLPNATQGQDFSKYLAEPGSLPKNAPATYVHKDVATGKHSYIPVRATLMPTPVTYTTSTGTETQIVYRCEAEYHCSGDGDCGQPLVYNNTIIGIHVAGDNSKVWYCMAIDRSIVKSCKDAIKQESSIFVSSYPALPVLKNNLKNLSIVDGETNYVKEVLQSPLTPITSLGVVLDATHRLYKPRAEDFYFRSGNKQIEEEFGPLASRPPRHVNGETQINTTLAKFNTPKMEAPISLMDRAMEDYVYGKSADGTSLSDYAASLERDSPGFFSVRPLSQALDGDGTGIVRGMNNQTSSGICYGGKKTNYLELDDFGQPIVPRRLAQVVENDIWKLDETWRSGQGTFDPFVRASKTNEVLPLEKAEVKTRSVYGTDMAFFIAATRGIIPAKHVLRKSEVSECFVGIAAQSDGWTKFHDYLTKGGEYKDFVCGDFSGYDTQLPKALLEKSAAIIMQLYKENGASESDLEYLRGILTSVVSPVMVWEGQLLQFCSGQPSGQPLTVEMNSIVNSLLIRMAFYVIMDRDYPHLKDPSFRKYVSMGAYGDDNAMGISEDIPLFNHTTIQAVFASWGIQYTMADKEADSVPYQSVDEVSFLKRTFRYHPQLDSIVAPLEEESLTKKFYWWTKSKNTPLTFPEQFRANFESQAREAYLHGVEYYEEFVKKCMSIRLASEAGDERFVLPWNTIQPISSEEMCQALKPAYHPEEE